MDAPPDVRHVFPRMMVRKESGLTQPLTALATAPRTTPRKPPLNATPIKAPGRLLVTGPCVGSPKIPVQPAPRSSTKRADGMTFSAFTPRMSATIFCNFSQICSSVICCLTAAS